jgi:hypothetical protein
MRSDNRFEEIDRAALSNALIKMHICPHCRNDLKPVAFFEDVWGCNDKSHIMETWHIPKDEE